MLDWVLHWPSHLIGQTVGLVDLARQSRCGSGLHCCFSWQLIINIAMVVIEQSPPGTQAKPTSL